MTEQKRVEIMREDEPIQGQSFACLSIASPTSRQKCNVQALKIRGVSGTEEDARELAEYLRQKDDAFDIYVAKVGVWLPLVFDPTSIKDQNYAESQLNEIVSEHMKNNEKNESEFQDRLVNARKQNEFDNSPEGVAKRLSAPEPCISVWHKMTQLDEVIKVRQQEYKALKDKFDSDHYSDIQRKEAEGTPLPDFEVAPATFADS
jgi:hypothetical protein